MSPGCCAATAARSRSDASRVNGDAVISGDDRHGFGEFPPKKCRLAPTVKQTGQESGGESRGNCQILIVSAVTIYEKCPQTA